MAGKRRIFEEVGAVPVAAPQAGGIDAGGLGARAGIRLWLMVLFALVAVMIAVGGLTRLTDSGLSITEWAPISGMVPPLSDTDWAAEFSAYQATAEFQLQNKAMTLDAFKGIFWWEWGHRQLGRVIGLVWAVGFVGFLAAGQIPARWTKRLLAIGGLIGLQGAIGWWMVSSGLTGAAVDVASYRLAVHLGLAFVILGLIAWAVFLLGRRETDLLQARRNRQDKLYRMTTGLMHFAFLQVVLGALVAGIDAGRNYPTWPDMNGSFFPADAFDGPAVALWANAGLVQFVHRMSGYVLFAFCVVVWLRGRKSPYLATRRAYHGVMAMMGVQVALGIVAVLTAAALHPAISHQIGAVVLWVVILRARYLANYPIAGSIRKGTA